jgi:Tfp pilus assembly pilus retraction ATPase PilT
MASEIMLATLAVSNLVREGKTFQLPSIIQTSRNIGMSTMEQSYVDLYMAGKRTYEQTAPLVKTGELIRQMQVQEASRNAEAAGGAKKRKWF